MKKHILFKLIIFFILQYQSANSQVVFYEDFGSSLGRIPWPYVPTSGLDTQFYSFAAIQSDYNGENLNANVINNGYYAVARPEEIYNNLPPGIPPGYDWWVANPGASPGAQNGLGAVLVVNGGTILNQYYRRVTTLMPGKKYRLTAYIYASGQSNVSAQLEIQNVISESVIGSSGPLPYGSSANTWVPFTWTFELPSDPCDNFPSQGALVAVSLRNALSASGGNDFYVDDILLEEVTIPAVDANFVCSSFELECSSTGSSVDLNSLYTGTPPDDVELVWFTTSNHQAGTEVADPGNVTTTGVYYAFFYDTVNDCYNTDLSTASVNVVILPPCQANLADLEVLKTVNNATPSVGNNVTFSIIASNNGPGNDTNVTIQDALPAGYTYVNHNASNGNGSYNSTTGLWTIGNLNNGASVTLTVTATVLASGAHLNVASISGDANDPDIANNVASASVQSACLLSATNPDSDTDSYPDLCDLDDDNDGILDTAECPYIPSPDIITNTSEGRILSFNTTTGIYTTLCPQPGAGVLGDIAMNSAGELYGITFSSGTNNKLIKINLADCSFIEVIPDLGFSQANSLSFLPDGNLLIGSGVDSIVRKIDIAGGTNTITTWHNFGTGVSNGDFIVIGNKMYVLWFDTTINPNNPLIFETTIDDNYNYISHTVLGPIQRFAFGLAKVNGNQLYAVTSIGNDGLPNPQGSVIKINLEPTFSWETIATYNQQIYGATSLGESMLECDTDGDGIPNRLDTDSDNDGCADAVEYYGNATVTGTDGNMYYGNGNPPAVNANGQVTGAPYSGNYSNAIVATQLNISTNPTDVVYNPGGNAVFTATAAGVNTTSFNNGTPDYTIPPATDASAGIIYQWQVSSDNGTNWSNVVGGLYSGFDTNTLTITGAILAMNGYMYRLMITSSNRSCPIISATASLIVDSSSCFQSYIDTNNTIDAYWPMDGNTNDTMPLSGNNNATATGAGVTFSTDAFAGTNAVSFAGTGGIQYNDGTFMNEAFTNLSWGAWIKPTVVSGGGNRLIFDEGGITNGIGIYLNDAGKAVFTVGKNGNEQNVSYDFPTDGSYHHLAFTYENGIFRMFIDGRLQGRLITGYGTIPSHNDDGGIGAISGTSILEVAFPALTFVPFNGLMDEVFYSKNVIQQGRLLQYGHCNNRSLFANIGCPTEAFMVQDDEGDYISINLFTGGYQAPAPDNYDPPTSQNGAGFNELDGLIYSIDADTGYILITELTPAGAAYNYNTYRVAYVPELDGSINTGDVYSGKMYVKFFGNNSTHYIIDVDPSSPTYLQLLGTVTSGTNTQVSDWAVNPQDAQLYTVGDNGVLYRFDPNTGAVTNLGTSIVPGAYGGVFFDSEGYLYIYNNATELVSRIDVDVSPVALAYTDLTGIGSLNKNDGARCPSAVYLVDYGDLPDSGTPVAGDGTSTGNYRTYLSDNGPRHQIDLSVPLTIGASVTRENDGNPSANANSDTDNGIASNNIVLSGGQACVTVTVQNLGVTDATLYGWIDFDDNGRFDGNELVNVTVPAGSAAGTNMQLCYNVTSFPTLSGSNRFSRFRLTTQALTNSNAASPSSEDTRSYGRASDGEVEDYRLMFTNLASSLTVTKDGVYSDTNGNGITNAGDEILYTFVVTNTGNTVLTNVSVTDNNATVSGGPLASLAVGASDSTTFTAVHVLTQADINAGYVYNLATATGNDPNGNPISDTSTDPTPCAACPVDPLCPDCTITPVTASSVSSLIVTKDGVYSDTNGNGITNAGDEILYTFVVTNTGNTVLTNVSVTDNNATVSGGPLASLAIGASDSTTFTAVHVLTQADINVGYVYNLATATGNDPDGNPISDTSTDPTPCAACPVDPLCPDCTITPVTASSVSSLTVTKDGVYSDTNGNGITNAGDEILYTFVVTNTGNTVLTNVSVTDNNATVSGGPLASLAVGASDSTTFTAVHVLTQADINAGYVYNLATATGNDPNGNPISDTSTDPTPCAACPVDPLCPDCTITEVLAPSLTVTKDGVYSDTNGNGITNAGDEILYTFVVTNTGNTVLTNVSVTDNNATVSGGPLASLAVGASDSTTFTAVHVLTQADINAGYVYNLATATGNDPNGNPISDTSTDPTPCAGCPVDPLCPDCTIVELINTTYPINDINNTFVNTPVPGNVLINDFDLEGDIQIVTLTTTPSNGTVVMNPDGSYVYTPNPGYTGVDTFTYTVCDDGIPQECGTATVTINVELNPAPTANNEVVANDDAVITEDGMSITIVVLANDFDPDGNMFTITPGSVTNPANGTVVVNPDGTITYTPNPFFTGEDVFTYQICDNGTPVTCDTATVIVTVLPNNNGANTTYAIDDSYFINCSSVSSMNLLANDYDLEGNQQTIVTTLLVEPLHGTVSINANGTFSYSVNGCYTGPDSFVYQVCDNGTPQACDQATVYLLIQDITPPVLVSPLQATISVNCDAIPALPVLEFSDVCSTDSNITVTSTEVVSEVTNTGNYTIIRTFTASDSCNNQTTVSQTINVSIPDYYRELTTEAYCNVDATLTVNLTDVINTQFPGMILSGGVFTDLSGVGSALSSDGVFTPLDLEDGDYIVRYENNDPDCPRIVEITIPVRRNICTVENCISLNIHNAFSPNGDGINEFFIIDNITNPCYFENTVEIFNRWGVKVFETSNYNNTDRVFGGYSNGRATVQGSSTLPSGTYFYVLKYKNIEGNYSSTTGWLYLNMDN